MAQLNCKYILLYRFKTFLSIYDILSSMIRLAFYIFVLCILHFLLDPCHIKSDHSKKRASLEEYIHV